MDNLNEIKETLKDMFKAAITNAKDGDEKGEWITINGTHVFIPEGKTAEDVIKEKGWKEKGEGKEKSDKSQDTPSEGKKGYKKLEKDELKKEIIKHGDTIGKSVHDYEDIYIKGQGMDAIQDALDELVKEKKLIIRDVTRGKVYALPTASDKKVKNGLSEIIKNCKPETKEDLKVLKGLKDILEEQ